MNVDQDLFDRLTAVEASILLCTSEQQWPKILPISPEEDIKDLLITRYGELHELRTFIETFGTKPLTDVRDQDGNPILHMVCGNGHLERVIRFRAFRACEGCHFNVYL